jgi:hypothetical protein
VEKNNFLENQLRQQPQQPPSPSRPLSFLPEADSFGCSDQPSRHISRPAAWELDLAGTRLSAEAVSARAVPGRGQDQGRWGGEVGGGRTGTAAPLQQSTQVPASLVKPGLAEVGHARAPSLGRRTPEPEPEPEPSVHPSLLDLMHGDGVEDVVVFQDDGREERATTSCSETSGPHLVSKLKRLLDHVKISVKGWFTVLDNAKRQRVSLSEVHSGIQIVSEYLPELGLSEKEASTLVAPRAARVPGTDVTLEALLDAFQDSTDEMGQPQGPRDVHLEPDPEPEPMPMPERDCRTPEDDELSPSQSHMRLDEVQQRGWTYKDGYEEDEEAEAEQHASLAPHASVGLPLSSESVASSPDVQVVPAEANGPTVLEPLIAPEVLGNLDSSCAEEFEEIFANIKSSITRRSSLRRGSAQEQVTPVARVTEVAVPVAPAPEGQGDHASAQVPTRSSPPMWERPSGAAPGLSAQEKPPTRPSSQQCQASSVPLRKEATAGNNTAEIIQAIRAKTAEFAREVELSGLDHTLQRHRTGHSDFTAEAGAEATRAAGHAESKELTALVDECPVSSHFATPELETPVAPRAYLASGAATAFRPAPAVPSERRELGGTGASSLGGAKPEVVMAGATLVAVPTSQGLQKPRRRPPPPPSAHDHVCRPSLAARPQPTDGQIRDAGDVMAARLRGILWTDNEAAMLIPSGSDPKYRKMSGLLFMIKVRDNRLFPKHRAAVDNQHVLPTDHIESLQGTSAATAQCLHALEIHCEVHAGGLGSTAGLLMHV